MISEPDRRSLLGKLRRVAGGCLVWRSSPQGKRHWYRTVVVGGKRHNVRRLLYALRMKLSAMPPPGLRLRQTCDNPACLNPRHLEVI